MKTTTWALAAALLIAAPAAAQRPDRPGGRGPGGEGVMMRGPGIERAVELALERRDSLGLSAEQVQRLEGLKADAEKGRTDLRAEMEKAREETREESRDDREATRERMRALQERVRTTREEERARFEQILTEPQRERLQQLMRQGRRRGPDGPANGGRGARPGMRRGALIPGFGPGPGGPALGVGRGFRARPGFTPGERMGYRRGFADGLRAGQRLDRLQGREDRPRGRR